MPNHAAAPLSRSCLLRGGAGAGPALTLMQPWLTPRPLQLLLLMLLLFLWLLMLLLLLLSMSVAAVTSPTGAPTAPAASEICSCVCAVFAPRKEENG